MKNTYKYLSIALILAFGLTACVKDLDTLPIDEDVVTSASVYETPDGYYQVLAKLYAGLAVSGQDGPAGNADISGIDEGFGQYLRGYWYHQELSTEEAIISWNDQTVKDFHYQTWGSSDVFIAAMYYRIFYQIAACNEYLRETTDDKLSSRNVDDALKADIALYRAEARFLRALSYYHALDLFGSVPFVTEEDPIGAFFPEQINRADLFKFVETELLAIESSLVGPLQNEYGRADQGAAWMLLAKLYLNAKVYTGTEMNDEVITYTEKVINGGYALEENYEHLFLADNDHLNEVIFSINYDGLRTQTYGGTNFIIHAAIGGDMNPDEFGVGGGWGGIRTTKALVNKFYPDLEGELKMSPVFKNTKDYPVLQVPGDYQEWDIENTETVIASVNSDDLYEGYLYFPGETTEFKFGRDYSWENNWGDDGADGTLEPSGANILVEGAGYYKLNVDMANLTYTAVNTTWGLIGSATPDGWDADQDMTYNPETGMWEILVNLVEGEVKFRANDDWALNYGDTDFDGSLEEGGDNILITVAGEYEIKLKLGTPDYSYSIERASYDKRAMFFTENQTLDIQDVGNFQEGYAITKFKNVDRDGIPGVSMDYVDTDFPVFRLADAYLMYAEATIRGGNGSMGNAMDYINAIRTRAYGSESGNVAEADVDLQFIIDERARELYWEGHRRTDLIRFEMFTGDTYVWPWKGEVMEGIGTDDKYNLYPLPSSDVSANPNLVQNTDY